MKLENDPLAVRDGDKDLQSLFRFSDDPDFTWTYLASDDESLMKRLMNGPSKKARTYAERLKERRLLKEVFSKYSVDFKDAVNRDKILRLTRGELLPLEARIAEQMKKLLGGDLDPDFVIIDVQSFSNPTFRPPGAEIRENDIMVLLDDRTRRNATEIPNTLLGKAEKPKEEAVSVYVPLDALGKAQRKRIRSRAEGLISAILEAL